jgi:serine/threonine-protein kinase
LYDSVMARVAQELAIEISPDLHASLAPMRPNDEEAYSLYLRGREKLQLPQEGPVLDDARDLLRAALDRDPDFARAFAGLCDTYVAQYRSTRDNALIAPAVEACNRALELDPAASEVQVAIAKLRTETGEYDAADAALQAALKRSPRSFDAYLRLGELRWGQQRLDDAEAAFKAAIDLQPGNYQGYSFYGALLVYRADYRRAEEQFSKVLSLTPDSTIALANLGGTYMLEGRLEDAVATYEKLLALQPNGQALSNLGLAYYYLGRYADAVSMLERAASLAPKDHRVLGNLAIAQSYDTRDAGAARTSYLRAIELAKERLAIDSEDADALSDLATYHAATGNRSEALSEIARAGALLPDDGATHYLAAIVHELLGDRQSALAQVHAAILAGYPRRFIEGDARLRELATFKASKGSVSGTAPVVFTAVTDWNASQDPHQAAGLDGRVIIQRPGATPFPLDVQSLVIGIAVGVAVAAVVFFTRYNVMQ